MKYAALLAPLILMTLVGCSPEAPTAQFHPDVNIVSKTAKAVEQLVGNLRVPLDTNKPILVTTVANIDHLDASSTFGRLIGEQVAASLEQDGYDVTEIRLRHSMRVDPQGEFMLSRDAWQLAGSPGAQAVVTGTYAVGARWVTVILKAVRLNDRKIIGTASYSVPNGPNTQSLLGEWGTDPAYVVGM